MSAAFCGMVGADNGTRRSDRASEIVAAEIAGDALEGDEIERLVPLDRAAERAAELLAMKILQLRAIRQIAAHPLEPLEMEHASPAGHSRRTS